MIPFFQQNIQLKDLCTFGIGGPARYFVEVRTIAEMQKSLEICWKQGIPFFILGKGSNCLFDDRGFDGAVILNKIDFLEKKSPEIIHVGAGYSFSLIGTQTARQGQSGLEFASGIPGSVGGAIFMNAGANGKETSDSLIGVDFLSEKGELHYFDKNALNFNYRHSSFQGMRGAIVGATFGLTPSQVARQKQIEIITYRKNTQPYGDKSAGCIFRNPIGDHAGSLIEKSGLKGVVFGGAKVSEKHANFLINYENSSSQDVLDLISIVKNQVREKTGIELESEVRFIPYRQEPS